VLASDSTHPEIRQEERLQDRPNQPINDWIHPDLARPSVKHLVVHRTWRTRSADARYSCHVSPLAAKGKFERPRTLRGAVCGAIAAAIWALEQPLDKLVFDSSYDDVELLGRAVTRSERWFAPGFAMHVYNGAMFGAVYANFAPAVPLPPIVRGPTVALVEHLALWPLGAVSDRFHPARDELPQLAGNRKAFAQSAWRHLLFGVVLGELERRLNAEPEPSPPEPEVAYASNGRGSLERAMPAGHAP
jgi:hypothetical protein